MSTLVRWARMISSVPVMPDLASEGMPCGTKSTVYLTVLEDVLLEELDDAGWESMKLILPLNGSLVAPSMVSVAFWPTLRLEMSAWLTWACATSSRGAPTVASAVPLLTLFPRATLHE